jgi:hypothetical protein
MARQFVDDDGQRVCDHPCSIRLPHTRDRRHWRRATVPAGLLDRSGSVKRVKEAASWPANAPVRVRGAIPSYRGNITGSRK